MNTAIPSTMKAIVLTGHGGFEKLVYRDDHPMPELNAGEVLVKVGACGLNNTDINTRTAWYSKTVTSGITRDAGSGGFSSADSSSGTWSSKELEFPRIQGADVAGRIVSVGSQVDSSRIGERVIIDPWLLGIDEGADKVNADFFGSECDGGYAQYTKVISANAHKIDSKLSDVELASFPCAYVTAENLVSKTALRPGETVVITGASGGVGSAAIQLCRLRGAKIIAIASKSKAPLLFELGATAVIDRNEADIESAIKDSAQGGIDVALDVVGGNMYMALINALRQNGRYCTSGAIAGPIVDFDLRQLIHKDLTLTGATIVPAGTMRRLVNLIESGKLIPLVAQSFALTEIEQAQQAFLEKKHVGNIVVIPPS